MNGYIISDGQVRMSLFSGNTLAGMNAAAVSPELCAMLGGAVGTLCGGGRVGVGYTGGPVGEAMKNAFVAGAQSAGSLVLDFGDVMESEAVFAISALGLGLSAYITGGPECSFRLLGVGGTEVSREAVRRLDDIISSGSFRRCCWNEYRPSTDINGIKLLYRRELYSAAPSGLAPMCARPVCSNPLGRQLFSDTLQKLGCNTQKGNIYRLSANGMSLTIEDPVAGVIGPKRVCVLSCGAEFERQNDVAVPAGAPPEIDALARRYARRVYRVGENAENHVMARAQYRMCDGIITAVRLMSFMRERNMTLEQMDMHF